jgi:hypothetical protein
MNELSVRESSAPVFQNLENQMGAIEALGQAITKSGFAGCERVEQGVIVAFTCLAEKITPIEFARSYDIIQGRPTKKAAVMLAEFRSKYGGDFDWVADGEDGKKATIKLTYKGKEKSPVSFSTEDAKAKGLLNKANWRMHLPEMLRARAATKALRMHVPEIAAGIYDPNELDDEVMAPAPVRMPTQESTSVSDLEFQLSQVSEDIRKEAISRICKRFEVGSIKQLKPSDASLVLPAFDSFIESLQKPTRGSS